MISASKGLSIESLNFTNLAAREWCLTSRLPSILVHKNSVFRRKVSDSLPYREGVFAKPYYFELPISKMKRYTKFDVI